MAWHCIHRSVVATLCLQIPCAFEELAAQGSVAPRALQGLRAAAPLSAVCEPEPATGASRVAAARHGGDDDGGDDAHAGLGVSAGSYARVARQPRGLGRGGASAMQRTLAAAQRALAGVELLFRTAGVRHMPPLTQTPAGCRCS